MTLERIHTPTYTASPVGMARACRFCGAPIVMLLTRAHRPIPISMKPKAPFRAPRAREVEYVLGEHEVHLDLCRKPTL
jgi:hypothetical protein